MTQLLDLPSEILVLILEEVGGRNLRRSTSYLTMCRKWYEAARAVYLSGLDVSKIQIHGCDIDNISGKWNRSSQRSLIHKNTRELGVRLFGHWWDQNSKAMMDESNEDKPNEPPAEFSNAEGRRAVMQWQRNVLDPNMKRIFHNLKNLEVLGRVSLETVLDASDEVGPQWPYLNSSTIATFLNNLPITKDLMHLTLDICSGLNYDEPNDAHICEELARILPRLETVRLRLKLICPSIFDLPIDITAEDIRLKSLVIKLHLPMFQDTSHLTPSCCTTMQGSHDPTYCQ